MQVFIRAACLSLAFVGALSVKAQASDCLSYENPVAIEGVLMRATYPGPPNYQSVAEGDVAETYFFLKPTRSFCVNAADDGLGDAVEKVTRIQLVLSGAQYSQLRRWIGRRLRLKGSLFGAITGHHRTPVLMEEVEIASFIRKDLKPH
ncbi:DUF4431 domain-containing protein [Microvirga sp. 2MCAF38]|uniref:DUF4431 domain-containing protein n=1 Tax=Microvirga sp. 2MCAF38 TaxID=3232989 RepID=UPI003F94F591